MQISHMSLVYFASRFARTLFARNQDGGGEGGVEKGKRYDLLIHLFIALSLHHFLCGKGKYRRDGKSTTFTH